MSKKSKNKINKGVAIIIVLILVIAGVLISYDVFIRDKEDDEVKEQIVEIDDRISPYTNQGLMVEILRIRNRGLLDKMMK